MDRCVGYGVVPDDFVFGVDLYVVLVSERAFAVFLRPSGFDVFLSSLML